MLFKLNFRVLFHILAVASEFGDVPFKTIFLID